ncbi:MAG: MBL fold metallo-hydrolase [Desulfobacterales bacterium]|nr:MBL fold metallo-hydrolase [Desulfobacterales bacterium]
MIWFAALPLLLVLGVVGYLKWHLEKSRRRKWKIQNQLPGRRFPLAGKIHSLTLTPVVEYHGRGSFDTEVGVSYWLEADDLRILMDVGGNWKQAHPSPLVKNLERLDLDPMALDGLVISHCHEDHVGGIQNEKHRQFSLSAGPVKLPGVPAWTPLPFTPSPHNPQPLLRTVTGPIEIFPGVGLTGPLPAALFGLGVVSEQALVFDLSNRGLVVVVGCGHPGLPWILDRAKALFHRPIHAVLGGFHLPVKGDRLTWGPIHFQWLVGSDRMPWKGLNPRDVDDVLHGMDDHDPAIVALSPHDSSDWVLDRFSRHFGSRFRVLEVGLPIHL